MNHATCCVCSQAHGHKKLQGSLVSRSLHHTIIYRSVPPTTITIWFIPRSSALLIIAADTNTSHLVIPAMECNANSGADDGPFSFNAWLTQLRQPSPSRAQDQEHDGRPHLTVDIPAAVATLPDFSQQSPISPISPATSSTARPSSAGYPAPSNPIPTLTAPRRSPVSPPTLRPTSTVPESIDFEAREVPPPAPADGLYSAWSPPSESSFGFSPDAVSPTWSYVTDPSSSSPPDDIFHFSPDPPLTPAPIARPGGSSTGPYTIHGSEMADRWRDLEAMKVRVARLSARCQALQRNCEELKEQLSLLRNATDGLGGVE